MKNILIISLFLLLNQALMAQKLKLIESKEEIIREATMELNKAMETPEGTLYMFAQDKKITGEYTLQLTIRDKGNVVSVFVADKKDWNIPSQNNLKDKLLDFRFGFKMPKNKDYKFTYVFKF